MNKISLCLGLLLLISCTEDSKSVRPAPGSNARIPGSDGAAPPVGSPGNTGANGSKGDKGDKGDTGPSMGTKLDKLAKLKECGDNPGLRITVWTETQARDGIMQKDEEASAQSSYLCDGAQGATGAAGKDGDKGADGRNGADGKNLAVLSETLSTWDSACYDKGGYRLKVWLDADADRIIDASEEASLSTHVICNGAKGDRGAAGPSGPSGSDGSNGKDAYTYTIKSIKLTSTDQGAIHNGRQTLLCSADVLTTQPDFYAENRLIGKIYSNGREILNVSGATLENDRYVIRFPVNAGWTAIGSTVSCEMALRSGYRAPGLSAKEVGPAVTVVENTKVLPVSMQDVLQTRAENFSGRLSFVFTVAADAPVANNRCELALHRTLDAIVEKSSFTLKKGESRVTLNAAIPKAFDLRLDRFTVSCEGDGIWERRLLWTDGLFEINPAATSNRNSNSYRLQLALLAVPFEFKDMDMYWPQPIRNRLTKEYLPKISLMTPTQRSGFILFLVKTKQIEILKNLTSLKSWYFEAQRSYPCNSYLTELTNLDALFGKDRRSMLSYDNTQDCSSVQQKASAASFASTVQDIEYSDREAIPDYLPYLRYFKIENLKNFVKLFKHVLTKTGNWSQDGQIADMLAVLQQQPELLVSENAALFNELLPLLDDKSAVTDSILALWPELRVRFEDRFLAKRVSMDRSSYKAWLKNKASAAELQSALDKLGKTAGFVEELIDLLPQEKEKVCPLMADAIKEKIFTNVSSTLATNLNIAMNDCQNLLVPALAEGLGAKLLSQYSMPKYVEALLKMKGESAPELASLKNLNQASTLEVLEQLRQGKITSLLALNALEDKSFKLSDFTWLQTRPLYQAVWSSLAQESAKLLLEVLNAAEQDSWRDDKKVSLYLQLIPAEQRASVQPLLLKASTKGFLVGPAKDWLLLPEISLNQASIEILTASLQDSSLKLDLKIKHVPLYKKAGLNLDALVEALIEGFSTNPTLQLFEGLGSIPEIQTTVVAAYGRKQLADWSLHDYFRAEGCSPEGSDALRELMPVLPTARKVLAGCLFQRDDIMSDEQGFIGSNLEDILERQTIPGSQKNAYLVPFLAEYLRLDDSSYALTSLVALAPFSTEVKGILIELQAIYQGSSFGASLDAALKRL